MSIWIILIGIVLLTAVLMLVSVLAVHIDRRKLGKQLVAEIEQHLHEESGK